MSRRHRNEVSDGSMFFLCLAIFVIIWFVGMLWYAHSRIG